MAGSLPVVSDSPAKPLFEKMVAYLCARTEAIVARFFPGFQSPGYVAGYRSTFMDQTELAWLLIHLRELGVDGIGGMPASAAIAKLLRHIDGPATNTFYSFRVAESLGEFGAFAGNPVLAGYTEAEKENLRQSVDSTGIYDPASGKLHSLANNYWAVLARCELGRRQLGLLPDENVFDIAMANVQELLFRNPVGFFDDSRDLSGRFDIYSADTQLFLEPLWPLLDATRLRENLTAHVRLLEAIALENGAFVGWGRSSGALSVCMTMELGGTALRLGLASDPPRMLALVEHAFVKFQTWIDDDLIRAHRGPMTEGYRGIYRLIQMTLDCLSKLCFAARQLSLAPRDIQPRHEGLFPKIDRLIPFNESGRAAVWMFRDERLTFQLPLVSGNNADYVPFPRCPGMFENPVESALVCGVPRIVAGKDEFVCAGLPASVKKTDDGWRLRFEGFQPAVDSGATANLPGMRVVEYRVESGAISAHEEWTFAQTPDAISLQMPESTRALSLQLSGDVAARQTVVTVEGMSAWRSCWGPLRRVHQIDFEPAREIRFTWKLQLALRVISAHCESDYQRSLYDAMPAAEVDEHRLRSAQCPWQEEPEKMLGDADVFHVGWPEHLFHAHGMTETEVVARNERLIARLQLAGVRVIWTMHNRRPHSPAWRGEAGDRLYAAWAAASDAVIHHSAWGEKMMRSELPYKSNALHKVIPHGHFGALMPAPASRAELERRFNLPPCAIRFGVLGRPQPEKQTDLIVRAFLASDRPDQQLIISAHPIETDVSGDPRIVLLPREGWLTRETIASHVHLCDALISAHTGGTYLTSGTIGDALGVGIPMLVNDWPFYREMFGDAAIYYDGTEAGLAQLFRDITPGDIARGKRDFAALQPSFAQPALAQETLALMRAMP